MRILASILVGFAISTSSALAADAHLEKIYDFDWDGRYWGVSLGAAAAHYSRSNCCPGPVGWAGSPVVTLQAGINRQEGDTVYGLEADISGHLLMAEGNAFVGDFRQLAHSTIRARVGKVEGPSLMYFTGGVAFTWLENSNPGFSSDSEISTGFTVGAGVETTDPSIFPDSISQFLSLQKNWTAKAEVLYVDVPETTLLSGFPVVGGSDNIMIRIGVNQHY